MEEDVSTEVSVDASKWEGEIDMSVSLVQVLGIPGVDADDLGLMWEIEESDGDRLNFKLNFTNPIAISQGDEADFVFCLLNLQQFKDEDGNALGSNLLVKVLLPRMV